MSFTVILGSETEKELRAAHEWYEKRSNGLGKEFILCVDACIEGIRRNPQTNQQIHKNVRRALTRKFPFGIFYLIKENSIYILAIFHIRRHPIDWNEREI